MSDVGAHIHLQFYRELRAIARRDRDASITGIEMTALPPIGGVALNVVQRTAPRRAAAGAARQNWQGVLPGLVRRIQEQRAVTHQSSFGRDLGRQRASDSGLVLPVRRRHS